MPPRIVVDTSVFTAALIGLTGPNREILRKCLLRQYTPLLGVALISELEDVTARRAILERCPISKEEVQGLLGAFCAVCEWVPIYFLWRPNVLDKGDNHVLELAVAGNAQWTATNNLRDFGRAQSTFPGIRVVAPEQLLQGA